MRQMTSSKSKPNRSLCSEILSGIWKGRIKEGGSSRDAERQLYFFSNGSITGSGAEGCTLSGSFSGKMLQWVETYDWGTMELHLEVKSKQWGKPATIAGSFQTTDGGTGSVSLSSPPPELQAKGGGA